MAENKGKFYMTTAIAYTSGKPHIGNTYEIILADAIARYKRAEGYDVYFRPELMNMDKRFRKSRGSRYFTERICRSGFR